jgi:adenylate kinase
LVSDESVCAVVGARLHRDLPNSGAILDGFPRTIAQARFLDSLLAELRLGQPAVIHLDISKNALLDRLTGRRQCAVCGAIYNLHSRPSLRGSRCELDGGALTQRDDDSENVILRRFEEFETNSAPLIDYYRGAAYHRIEADREPEAVASEILSRVARVAELQAA